MLYGRRYCHLCDDMVAGLRALQREFSFDLEVRDLDDDQSLDGDHGERIPVLEGSRGEICHFFLDEAKVREYLRGFG